MKIANTFSLIVFTAFLLCISPQFVFAQKASAEYIATISPPAFADTISVKDGERYVTFHGGYLYTVNYWSGVQIVDVSDVHHPRKLAFINTRDNTYQVTFHDNTIYIASDATGVLVYDVSDPAHPKFLARIKTPGNAVWVDVAFPYLYVALGEDGFCIMDIQNLDDVRTLSLEPVSGYVWSLKVEDAHLYLAAKKEGLLIYDVTDPTNLLKMAQYRTGYPSIFITIRDKYAFLAEGPGGMLILDISQPSLPQKISRFKSKGFARHIFLSGNYAYIVNWELGLQIVNISDLAHPFLEGEYIPESESYCVFKKDVYVYLTTNTGTEILRHNNQPVLEPINDVTIDENQPLVIQLKAYDPDGDPIVYSAQNLPPGSQFNDSTGIFSWTPTYEQSGVYGGIIFRVTEQTASRLSVADTVTITVRHVNRLPDLPQLSNVTIKEDSLLVIQIPEASDPDSEDVGKLTYHAENLPEGATFDSTRRVFRWKPTFDQSGVYVVDFVVRDGMGGADREPVTITVEHVDRPPVIEPITDQTVDEGQTLTIQVKGTEPDKEDQDKIEFSMKNLPPGATFDPQTALFTWTPNYDQSGVYPGIVAIMKAGAFSDSTTFTITVNHVNRPPVLDPIADQTVNENEWLRFTISGSDPDVEDSGKIVFSAENLPEGARFNPDSLKFSWKPTYEQAGTYSGVVFKVTDPQGLSDQKSITITVNNVNRPPVLEAVPPLTVDENQLLEYQLKGSDPDAEDAGKLHYTANPLPEGAELDVQTGLFRWTPNYEQSGSYSITFVVSDGELADSQSTTITVNHVNRPPVAETSGSVTGRENEPLAILLKFSDPDKEDQGQLNVSVGQLPEGATFDAASNTIQWTPGYDQAGDYTITYVVTDPQGARAEETIAVHVENVNRPPVLNVPGDQTGKSGETIRFTVSASDPDKEDEGNLNITASGLPANASFNNGQFEWTPSPEQSGSFQVTFRVEDSHGASDEKTVTITVQAPPPPEGENK